MSEEHYLWRIGEFFPSLAPKVVADLKLFHVELLKFNLKVNLVSINTLKDADIIHFADSVFAMEGILKQVSGRGFVDIGSGNGFPGIVGAILKRECPITLVDSDIKKCEFLKHMASRLELKNVKVECKRVEELAEGSVGFAVSRAFAPLPRALMVTRKAFAKGGIYFNLKGTEWPIEVASLPHQLCSTWNTSMSFEYSLPLNRGERAVIVSQKKQ